MSAHLAALRVAVLLVTLGAAARAQAADTTRTLACRRAAAPAGMSAPAAGGVAGSRGAIDTVITLNITDRTWQRDSVSAGVSLGAAGTAGARRAPWHACAGATVTLGRVTATLHDVHGQIHLKADPAPLDAIGGTARSGTTPPAPPRR